MKKLVLSLSLLFAVVLGIYNVATVKADTTNLFDPTKVTTTISGDYIISFGYNDPTLPDGLYTFELKNQPFQLGDPELVNYYIETSYQGQMSIQWWIDEGLANIVGSAGNYTLVINDVIEGGYINIGQLDPQAAQGLIWNNAITTTNFSLVMNEVDGVEPVFTYSSLQVNAVYNALPTAASIKAQLGATDDVDGDVTSRIEIYNDAYTAETKVVGGDYYIMFRVSDTAGNYAYLRVDIEVIDNIKPYLQYDGSSYYDGQSITLDPWYNDDSETEKLTLDEIRDMITYLDGYYVYDPYDYNGILVDVSIPGYVGESEYYDTVGTYEVHVELTDLSNNTATIIVNLTVLENHAPVITGPASQTVEITSFNFASILAQYSATDTEDGTVAITVDASTTWNYASPTIGSFNLVLRATDSNGKYTLKTVPVTVRDTTIPVFKINNIAVTNYSVTVNMSDTSTLQALIDSIVITDAYYGTLTSSKVVPALPSLTVPAVTNITITCTDASGNVGSLVLTITVADDVLPVINGPIKVVKGKTATMVTADITAQLSAVDNVSGALSVVVVSDGYSGNMQTIGSYLIQYKATDAAGNIKYHDVRVWVVDNVAPVWVFDDYFINLGVNETMTKTELIALLQASGMLANDLSYTVTFLTDEYSGNELIEGAYNVTMRITYANGSQSDISVQLAVPAADDGDVIVVTPETPQTGFQKFLSSVKNLGVKVWTAIQSGWNWVKNAAVWTYDHIIYPVYQFIFVKDTVTTIPPVSTNTTTTVPSTTTTTTLPPVTTTSNPAQSI